MIQYRNIESAEVRKYGSIFESTFIRIFEVRK